jgi:integrase
MPKQQTPHRRNGSSRLTLQQAIDRVTRRYWRGTRSETKTASVAKHVEELIGPEAPLDEIDETTLDEFVDLLQDLGNRPGTINRKLSALQKVLRWAYERRYIDRMPKIERIPETNGRIRWLSDVEEQRLFDHAERLRVPGNIQALWQFLLYTGLRLSEALNLEWEDADLENRKVYLWETKANNPRTVPLCRKAREALERVREKPDGPFSDLYNRKVNRQWDRVRKAMGLEGDEQFVLHALRHTFCTRLVQNGADLYRVQKLAGHKDVKMTQRYAHLRQDDLAEAVQLLD